MIVLLLYLRVFIFNMETLLQSMQIKVSEKIYLKNPENSELGKRILRDGHRLMDEIGFESFTFKKLAEKINTTESSVYRYFESKHQFLLYLLNWYWSYLEYQVVFNTYHLKNPSEKLKKSIELLTEAQPKNNRDQFELARLQRISINESPKAYLIHEVDKMNMEGYYMAYKRLCKRVADILLEINPNNSFANSTAVIILDGIGQQKFYAEHLPSLSSFSKNKKGSADFFYQLAINSSQARKKI